MKIFLDDTRYVPFGYLLIRDYNDLIILLKRTNADEIEEISLDYDLSSIHTGLSVCMWMKENNYWPKKINVHSTHTYGKGQMIQFLKEHAPSFVCISLHDKIIRDCN